MNYAGKFDAKLPTDGSGLHSQGHARVETTTQHSTHAPSDAIIVPDAQLLFNGDFKQSGVDLILSNDDHELVLQDYFKGEKRAALSSPDGAHLTGDLVNALTGHTQYAQADGSASASHVIGHVSKLVGTATAIRNGVSIILNNGDNVEKGDVVQSGSDSTLGITFIDGTVFGLLSNARIVLNEMVYDPNGSNNSSLLSLVAGTISFVAGNTAKHGDMKIDTPVATMGIRGTAVLVEIDFIIPGQSGLPNIPSQTAQPEAHFQVLVEPDGTTGSYILFDKNTLTPIATVNQAGQQINISQGQVSITNAPLPPDVQKLIQDVFTQKFTDNTNPQTLQHFTDTIIPQSLLPIMLANGATAIPIVATVNSSGGSSSSSGSNGPTDTLSHIDLPPTVVALGAASIGGAGTKGSSAIDTTSGVIRFADINRGDRPTVKVTFSSFTLQDAQHNDVTAILNAQQLAAIKAVEASVVVVPDLGNNNNGSVTWTYSLPDKNFAFLTTGETLILTYLAEVDTNYAPNNTAVFTPVTITITALGIVEWIHPTGGLWSVGSNWNSGTAPTATDDASIPAEQIIGGTGLYDVTIATPAVARTLTLNDNHTSGGQVINDSTLTIGEALTIFDNGVLNNLGTVSVGGKIELLNQSSLQNSGLITLGLGGDFQDQSSVSNTKTGTIEVSGGTLNVQVDVANSGLLVIDPNSKVTLNGATVTGGTVTNDGIIDLIGAGALKDGSLGNFNQVNVSGSGNALDGETVSNIGTIYVTGVLTLDLGTTIIGGTLANLGTVKIEATSGATLDGVNVENGSGDIQVDNVLSLNASTLIVDDGTTISGGTVTIGSVGNFEVMTALGATLDNVSISNSGIVQVDTGSKLNLNGTTISGGTIADNGTIETTGDSTINGAAVNGGQVTVDASTQLTLDNVTVTGTTITDKGKLALADTVTLAGSDTITGVAGSSITNAGLLDVTGTTTLNSDSLTNTGTLKVDGTLKLNGTTISGGTIADNGTIETTGDSTINGAAVNGGQVTVDASTQLTLDNVTVTGTTITDKGKLALADTVTLAGSDTITGVAGSSITNAGLLDVTGTTTLNSDSLTNTGTLKVDGTLKLNGTTISGGTIADNGTIETTGDSTINGAAVNGGQVTVDASTQLTLDNVTVTGTTITDKGKLALADTVTLAGSDTITGVAGSSITNAGLLDVTGTTTLNSDSLTNTGTLKVDGTLKLNGTTISGGTIADNGTIETTGDSTINGAAVNGGQVTVDASTQLTLDNVTVTGTTITDKGKLALADTVTLAGSDTITGVAGSSITNAGLLDVTGTTTLNSDSLTNTGTLKVDGTLKLNGTTISGGTIADNGTIETTGDSTINGAAVNGGQVTVDASTQLTLDNVTVTGTTITDKGKLALADTVTLAGSDTITGVAGSSITNAGLLDVTGTTTLNSDSLTNTGTLKVDGTLKLNGTTISGGTIADNGTIETTGDSTINGAAVNGGQVTVDASTQLTLDNVTVTGTTITDKGKLALADTVTLAGSDTITGVAGSSITNAGLLDVTGTTTLNSDSLTNTGTLKVDGTLKLNGTTISGGTIADNGTIETTGDSTINGAAVNGGQVTVDASTQLTLDNVTVTGTTITDKGKLALADTVTLAGSDTITGVAGSSITNAGLLDVTGTTTLNSDSLTNTGTLKVDGTLKLNGTTISGGTIADNGTIETTGDSTINGAAVNGGQVTVDASTQLTLDNVTVTGTTITDKGKLALADTVTLAGSDTITGVAGSSITNAGLLDVTGTTTLNSDSLTNTGTLKVDGTLKLNGTTISGGTIADNGTIETTGDSTINGAAVNGGQVTVDASTQLTLDNVTVTGTTITDKGKLALADTVTLAGSDTITGVAGSSITNAGLLDVTGTTTLNSDSLTNTGTLKVDGTLKLNGTTISGGILSGFGTIAAVSGDNTLDSVTIAIGTKVTANNLGTLDLTGTITDNGEIDAAIGGTIDLESVTIVGGTLGGPGTIATVSGADTLNSVAIAGGTTVKVTDNTALDLKGTIANGGTIALNSSGDATQLKISGNVLLNGSGRVTLTDNTNNIIVSDGLAATLTNSTTITGTGTIGDTLLTLANNGTIDATGTHPLTIDTGTNTTTGAGPVGSHWSVGSLTVTNNAGGVLEASAGSTLQIDDNVLNNGLIKAGNTSGSSIAVVNVTGNITGTGSIEIFNNAKLEIGGSVSSGQTVTFGAPGGAVATAATLILDDLKDFHGVIIGLTESSNESLENHVDLKDLTFISGHMSAHFNGSAVTVSNGTKFCHPQSFRSFSSGSFELAADATGGTLLDDPPASGMVTIDSGTTLDISAASTATVSFTNSNGNTGELVLDNSKDFTGQIVGFAGDGTTSNSDLIDLTDVNIADVAIDKTTYTDNGNGTGTLTLYNANGQALDSITFVGSYQLANFTIENDGSGHTLIVDPPVPSGTATVAPAVVSRRRSKERAGKTSSLQT